MPALPRRLRHRDARRPLPQRLRAARHVRRWPREGARCDLPQGRAGEALRRPTRSRSGATASRRGASCTSTTACSARPGSWRATSSDPINLGSSELVTINQLVDIVEEIAGVRLTRRYDLDAPKGVRGRNSDNTAIRRPTRLGAEHAARRQGSSGRTPGSTTSWRRAPRPARHRPSRPVDARAAAPCSPAGRQRDLRRPVRPQRRARLQPPSRARR